jgi:hypothetical protein
VTKIGLLVALPVAVWPPSVEVHVAVCSEIHAPLFAPLLKATLAVDVVVGDTLTVFGESGGP